MKRFLGLVLLLMISAPSRAQDVARAEILQRVYQIRFGDTLCSAFTLDVDKRQYLITARHCVVGIEGKSSLFFRQGSGWDLLAVTRLPGISDDVDIAIFSPSRRISVDLPLEGSSKGMILGQDMYYFGFPLDTGDIAYRLFDGSPLPFVKHGILSAIFHVGDANILAIDSIVNPGFSGGPIAFWDASTGTVKVAAVTRGFPPEEAPVKVCGKEIAGMTVQTNTGIAVGFLIDTAIAAIRAHPQGFPIQ